MKSKKWTISFLLMTAALAWYYFYSQHKLAKINAILQTGPSNNSQAITVPTTLSNQVPIKEKLAEKMKTQASKVIESEENNFDVFDKMEKVWLGKVEAIIGATHYALYLDMRNRNDKEKMQAYKEYHDYLRLKYGDKFSYNISEDQSVREKQINQRYLDELVKLIGDEKFKIYLKSRDQFNEDLRRTRKEAIQIEF